MEVNFSLISGLFGQGKIKKPALPDPQATEVRDGFSPSSTPAEASTLDPLQLKRAAVSNEQSAETQELPPFQPILNTVKVSPEKMKTPVPAEVLDRAQEYLDRGDRGAAYLTLYQELGNEQILIQTGITTYTGFWGSGALTGNHLAQRDGGDRYTTKLDDFSVEIAQAIRAAREG